MRFNFRNGIHEIGLVGDAEGRGDQQLRCDLYAYAASVEAAQGFRHRVSRGSPGAVAVGTEGNKNHFA